MLKFYDIYSISDLMRQIPFYAESCMSVSVSTYGYLHDVGTVITLENSSNPTGWDTLESDLAHAIRHVSECWTLASASAYHGGM